MVESSRPSSHHPLRTALCVGQWLPASETFIYDQLAHQERTRAVVFARDRTEHAERFPYDDVVHLGPLEQASFYHLAIAPTVSRTLKERRTELVHAHFGPNGTMMLPFAKAMGIPLVVSLHGHDVGGLEPQNRRTLRYGRYQRLASKLFDYGSLFLCASEELCSLMLGHGAPPAKVQLHHLGVNVGRFVGGPEHLRDGCGVLMVGRLVEKKGMFDGLKAFARVAQRLPEAWMAIVGDGPLRRQLEAAVLELDLSNRVRLYGALSSEQVLFEMQRATVLLTPSFTTASGDRESGVIVIKEAGATGLPTVATRHGGIPEIIEEGKTGYMVSERNVDQLADRLERLLRDPELSQQMGRAARETILSRYDSKKQNEILEDHLLRVQADFGK